MELPIASIRKRKMLENAQFLLGNIFVFNKKKYYNKAMIVFNLPMYGNFISAGYII